MLQPSGDYTPDRTRVDTHNNTHVQVTQVSEARSELGLHLHFYVGEATFTSKGVPVQRYLAA